MNEDENPEKWISKARILDHKPDPVDSIPEELMGLGEVFFPIPPLRKGWKYPHGSDDHRFGFYSETLNAYMEQGWNYGIACAGSLVVIDVDEMEYITEVTEGLPETLYQITGSRTGVHFFYLVEGLNSRIILKDDTKHVGEIKCDPHGYVVGPGSTHPSGDSYGPLKGNSIARVKKSELLYELNNVLPRDNNSTNVDKYDIPDYSATAKSDIHDFYRLSADDIMPSLSADKRISHPVHGSESGSNFMKNKGGETFTCWRCQCGSGDGCVLAPVQYLAVEGLGNIDDTVCEEVKRAWRSNNKLHFIAWREAVSKGIISPDDPPSRVVSGFAEERDYIEPGVEMERNKYYAMKQALLWETGDRQHYRDA